MFVHGTYNEVNIRQIVWLLLKKKECWDMQRFLLHVHIHNKLILDTSIVTYLNLYAGMVIKQVMFLNVVLLGIRKHS